MATERLVDDGVLERLAARTRELLAEHRVPGAAVGIVDGNATHMLCFGQTSLENPLDVDADTLFQIGSTTKTVTATVLVRLAEQRRVDLDAPVRRYLPDFELRDADAAARVTVRQLLLHTAGWEGDVFVDTGDGDDALARYVAGLREVEQVTPLGTVWSYNNAALCVAGRVVEAVTGGSYEAAAREHVLGPLGMDHSTFRPRDAMLRRFAVGHVVRPDRVETARPWPIPRSSNAAGGIASSVRDQLRYARFHLGDGTAEDGNEVLSTTGLRSMQEPQVPAELGSWMGLSWFLTDVDGYRVVAHGGATNGQMSSFWMVPDRRFAFTMLTNADTGRTVGTLLQAWVQEHVLGLRPDEPEPVQVEPGALPAYAGTYRGSGSAPTVIEVQVEGDSVRCRIVPGGPSVFTDTPPETPPPFLARFVGADRIRAEDGPSRGSLGEFLRDDRGRIGWLRAGKRIYARIG